MPQGMDERYQEQLTNQKWEQAKAEFHADPSTAPGVPTAEQEAVQAPGEGENLATQLVDPGVLLDPANLGSGAGVGAKAGGGVMGALKGAAQAAGGLLTPALQLGKGLVKGLTGVLDSPQSEETLAASGKVATTPVDSRTLPDVPSSAEDLKNAMLSKLSIQRVGKVGEEVVSTRSRLKVQEELAGRQLAGTDPSLDMLRDINPNTPLSDTDLLAFKE